VWPGMAAAILGRFASVLARRRCRRRTAARGGGDGSIERIEAAAELHLEVGFVELAAGRGLGRAGRDADDGDARAQVRREVIRLRTRLGLAKAEGGGAVRFFIVIPAFAGMSG